MPYHERRQGRRERGCDLREKAGAMLEGYERREKAVEEREGCAVREGRAGIAYLW